MSRPDIHMLATTARPAWLWDPARRRIAWANPAAVALFGEEGLLALLERPFDAEEVGVARLAEVANQAGDCGESGCEVALAFPSAGLDAPLPARAWRHPLPDGRDGLLVATESGELPVSAAGSRVLREVLRAMPLAVTVCDGRGTLVYANPAAREMFDEAALAGLRGLFATAEEMRGFLARAARAGLAARTVTARTRLGDRRVRIVARPMAAAAAVGGGRLFSLLLDDVSDRIRLEEELLRGAWPTPPDAATETTVSAPPPTATGERVSVAETTASAPAADTIGGDEAGGGHLPLSEEDIETFHRLSTTEKTPATTDDLTGAAREDEAGTTATGETAAPAEDEVGAPAEATEAAESTEATEATKTAGPAAEAEPAMAATAADDGGHGAAVAGAEDAAAPQRRAPAPPEKTTVPAAEERGGESAAAAAVPELVRQVLDHRPEPIVLHRDGAFIFANRAAREVFGLAIGDPAWEALAIQLAGEREGAPVDLTLANGEVRTFTLRRDVFPWRDGAVVQSTLLPAEEARGDEPVPTPEEETNGGATDRSDKIVHAPGTPQPTGGHGGRVKLVRIHPPRRQGPAPSGTGGGEKGAPRGDRPQASPAGGEPAAQTADAETGAAGAVCMAEPLDEELRAILDTATDGIITLNRDGEVLSFSGGAEALFGLSAREVVGRPFADLLEGESRRVVEDYLEALNSGGHLAGIYNEGREVTARVAGGGRIPLFITIGRLGRSDEVERPANKAAYCVVVRDITQWKKTESELRRAKEEAERSSAMKSEFLASISHELRTPLNAILGFSDVMRNERFGAIGNEKYRGYANDIYQSGEHLLSLINDLLDLSRIEAGKFELRFEDVDVAAVAEEALHLMQEQAAQAKVMLRRVMPEGLPRVVADARSLKQILLNLLSNAVKFTGEGGQVVLTLRTTERGELEIAISDTGVGMSEEELARAMRPFERITGDDRPDRPGTGLGLPLTKALAEANHARFEIESEPGRGTTVRIVFPTQRVLA